MAGVILNELRGQPEVEPLQKLVQSLAERVGVERMAQLLPWREDVIKRLAASEKVTSERTWSRPEDRYVGRIPLVTAITEEAWDALQGLVEAWKAEDVGQAVQRALLETWARVKHGGGKKR